MARVVRPRKQKAQPAIPPPPPSSSPSAGAPGVPSVAAAMASDTATTEAAEVEPDWARDLKRRQSISHGLTTAAHVARSTDHGGAGANPSLDSDG